MEELMQSVIEVPVEAMMAAVGDVDDMKKVQQQVTVMRREIKNLRQMLDGAVRAHRKHMSSIQSAVSLLGRSEDTHAAPPPSAAPSQSVGSTLEQGIIQTVPIGYITSCFSLKNGTPRQPTICGPSRAELRIRPDVFNNPHHALLGLEHFSHVWIVFVFHKNGHLSYKAKVKPPRLNGQRVGVYSTRSPHRPNALGLTLAKLDNIVGDTLHLSDIDMIAGTPVLDIKPYIPDYDSPQTRTPVDPREPDVEESDIFNLPVESQGSGEECLNDASFSDSSGVAADVSPTEDLHKVLEEVKAFVDRNHFCQEQVSHSATKRPPESAEERLHYGEEACGAIADWIRAPPVGSLEVRFTPNAERELAEFIPAHQSGPSEPHRPRFKFLRSTEEAAAAIRGVLSADPRSVYRRTRCSDRLFFFTLDSADITCWFGQDFAEVLQVQPVDVTTLTKACHK